MDFPVRQRYNVQIMQPVIVNMFPIPTLFGNVTD